MVCEESKARPIEGSATLATDRLRLAIAATRISVPNTTAGRAGAVPDASGVAVIVSSYGNQDDTGGGK